MKRTLVILLLALAAASRLQAQDSAATLISSARALLDQFSPDSATDVLVRVLAPSSGATTAERVRAYVLFGIAQLTAKNVTAARQAFRQALQLNPAERVDSLEFLEPEDLLREFNAERAAMAPVAAPSALAVDVDVPSDTTVSPPDRRFRITTKTSYRARVVATVAPADAQSAPVWSDTAVVENTRAAAWNLHDRGGLVVPSGRYVLHVSASDSLGHVATPIERVLVVATLTADTTPTPPPIPASAFAPETVGVHPGSPLWLAGGVALSAVYIASTRAGAFAYGSQPLFGQQGTANLLVALAFPVAGLVVFLAGHHPGVSPENIQHNRDLREKYAQRRAYVAQANARARENAPVRVRVERTFP